MPSQKKAEAKLIFHHRKLWTIITVVTFMTVMAFLYFKMLPGLTGEALQVEHRRLQNILASVRSQWQIHGEPDYMNLEWLTLTKQTPENSLVKMSARGFPLPSSLSDEGCEELWYKLLGVKLDSWEINGEYHPEINSCKFVAVNLASVIYELSSGNVNFLTD